MTKILITGASGMVGKHLVDMCLEKGYYVRGTDIRLDDRYLEERYWGDNFDFFQVDLRNFDRCKVLVDDIDVVFQVAGVKGSPKRAAEQPNDYFTPMLQMNTNMAEAARLQGVDWYVYTSTVGVYQPAKVFKEDDVWKTFPSDNDWFAGWAKRIGEMNVEAYMKENKWNKCSIVRPANVYGPFDNFGEWSMVVPSLIKKANENDVLEVWGDGSPIRDLIYSEDVARGMIHMVENKVTEPINLGSGNGVTIRQIAEIVSDYFKKEIVWDKTKPMGDSKRLMSMERAISHGFTPNINLEDGILKTIDWYLGR